jgi:hypothetical protein
MCTRLFCATVLLGAVTQLAALAAAVLGHHRDAMLLWLGPLCAVAFLLILASSVAVAWREMHAFVTTSTRRQPRPANTKQHNRAASGASVAT